MAYISLQERRQKAGVKIATQSASTTGGYVSLQDRRAKVYENNQKAVAAKKTQKVFTKTPTPLMPKKPAPPKPTWQQQISNKAIGAMEKIPEAHFADNILKYTPQGFGGRATAVVAGVVQATLNTPKEALRGAVSLGRNKAAGTSTPKQVAGDIAAAVQLPLLFVGGGSSSIAKQGIKEATKQFFKQGPKQILKTVAKHGAIGGGFGALAGLQSGRDIEDNKKYIENILENAKLGAAVGYGGAAATHLVIPLSRSLSSAYGAIFLRNTKKEPVVDHMQVSPKVAQNMVIKDEKLSKTPLGKKIMQESLTAQQTGEHIAISPSKKGKYKLPDGTKVDVYRTQEYDPSQKAVTKFESNIDEYRRFGGATDGQSTENAALRDIAASADTPEIREYTQKKVQEAIEKGELKLDKDGMVTLYRGGEPSSKNELISAAYSKEVAQSFSEHSGKLYQFRVKPDDIKAFIGKAETEVLLKKGTLMHDDNADIAAYVGNTAKDLEDNYVSAANADRLVGEEYAFYTKVRTLRKEGKSFETIHQELSNRKKIELSKPDDNSDSQGKTEESPIPKMGEQKYDYQSTQVNLQDRDSKDIIDFAKKIPEDELSKDPTDNYKAAQTGREDQPHITTLYGLGNDVTKDDIQKVLGDIKPFEVKLGKTSLFENDKYDVLKVDIDSPELRLVNKKLKALPTPGETFKDYKPHITIAYLKKGEGKKYSGNTTFEGKTITFNELTFSRSDGVQIKIPLKETVDDVIEERVFDKKGKEITNKKVPVFNSKEAKVVQEVVTDKFSKLAQEADDQDKLIAEGTKIIDDAIAKANGERYALSGIRTAVNKEMFNAAGVSQSSNFGANWAELQTVMKESPDIGKYIETLLNKRYELDDLLIGAEAKPGIKPQEKISKAIAGPKEKPAVKVVKKTDLETYDNPVGTGKLKNSKYFQRLKESFEDEVPDAVAEKNPQYKVMNREESAFTATKIATEDPARAFRIANGLEKAPEGMSTMDMRKTLAFLAREKEDWDTFNKYSVKASLAGTRAGQEIVSLRGRNSDHNPMAYVDQIVKQKKEELLKRYDDIIHNEYSVAKDATTSYKVKVLLEKEAVKLKKKITAEQRKIQSAQSILDALKCK